jgi:hypothetical protein
LIRAVLAWPRRHWRGELPLGVSLWLNTVALGVGAALLWPWAARLAGLLDTDTAGSFLALAALRAAVVGLLPLWQVVGLFRSAARRVATDGRPEAWSRGRLGQLAGLAFLVFAAGRGLTVAAELTLAARPALALGPYAFRVTLLPSGREIELTGGLGFGVTRAVTALLDDHPRVRRLRLNSGGGALGEAQRLRALIAARGLDTITTSGCSSACVSAYMGGRFRYLQRGAPMGVHLPRNWQQPGAIAPAFVAELAYFRDRGVPDWFLSQWIRSGREFWYPDEWLLLRAGVVMFLRGPPARPAPEDPVL